MRNKFDELNDLVMKGEIRLPEPNNELEYLFSLPSDFGGLGNLFNEHKYENLKLYDPKSTENKDKRFMSQVKIERKMIWFPLLPNSESLNNKFNPYKILLENLKNKKNEVYIKQNEEIKKLEGQNKDKNDENLNKKEEKDKKSEKYNYENNNEANNSEDENRIEKENRRQNMTEGRKDCSKSRKKSRSRSRSKSKSRKYINENNKYNRKYCNIYYGKNNYENKKKYRYNYFNKYKKRYFRYNDY